MRGTGQQLLTAALTGAMLLLTAACEDSPPTAASDWELQVTANPATIQLPTENQDGESTITAALFDSKGAPKSGIGLRFSTGVGTMKSGGKPIKTDGAGVAKDVLVTRDPAQVTVSSGSVSETVTVKVNSGTAPTALISFTPKDQAAINQSVQISGALSEDLDGEIVRYDWKIFSTVPAYTEEVDDGGQALIRTYPEPMSLTVTLLVTDDTGAKGQTTDTYEIFENLPPTVDAGPPQQGRKVQDSPYTCVVTLSACNATDPDGRVVAYEFFWGDSASSPSTSCTQNHTYGAVNTYTVTIYVYDNGNAFNLSSPPVPTCNQPPPALCPTRKSGSDTTTVTCPA